MRLPSILDLLDAVTRVSRAHPVVRAWWLTPRARLPLRGEPSHGASIVRVIDLAVESEAETAPDCRRIERELSQLLPASSITVRAFRPDDRQKLMRLLSVEDTSQNGRMSPPATARDDT
jgi:hypothetical protein